MNIDEIFAKIQSLEPDQNRKNTFFLFRPQEENKAIYYGIDEFKNIVFISESLNPNVKSTFQSTKELTLSFNVKSDMLIDGEKKSKIVHILTCKTNDHSDKLAFIRLTEAFAKAINAEKPYLFCELFSALVNLFANKQKASETELQGFFAELYTIIYFFNKGIDLIQYWQEQEKMKFDFTINELKRMEIKSTLREERIHHFKHEQLLSNMYDIVIASFLLRQTNEGTGLSVMDAITKVRSIPEITYNALLYVENFIKNIPKEDLVKICYDETYTQHNLKFYKAQDVPKFLEKQPPGVSGTVYNSNLSTSTDINVADVIDWINM